MNTSLASLLIDDDRHAVVFLLVGVLKVGGQGRDNPLQ